MTLIQMLSGPLPQRAAFLVLPRAVVFMASTLGVACCPCCQTPVLDNLPIAVYAERWLIAGYLAAVPVGDAPATGWMAVSYFPGRETVRIAPCDLPGPDGWVPVSWDPLAFNQEAEALLCWADRDYGPETRGFGVGPHSADVCLYDVRSRKGRWIGRKRWKGVSRMSWSADGTKVAFTGTEIRTTWEPRRGRVWVYDLASEKLTEVADDGVVRHSPRESRPPVWSEDGRYLYYASIAGRVMRLELGTGNRETLPISALAVVTVRGSEILLIASDPVHPEAEWIVKRRLDALDEGSAAIVLDKCGWTKQLMVSPSRRFILYYDWRGYVTGGYVLLDTQTGRTYKRVAGYIPERFEICVTSFTNRANKGADVTSP